MMNYEKPVLSGRRIWEVPEEEVYSQGHLACPGCGVAIAARLALKALGRNTIFVVPACCFAVIDGPFPHSAAGLPLLHCAFETAASTASGVRAGLAARGENDTLVLAWAGDGGTYDIGFQALSAAAERNEDILYVCYDNEAYMNTGVQRSGATPFGAWTTTTPVHPGKREFKKDLAQIMLAHRIPYFATVSLSHVDDFLAKFRRAREIRGFRFIHLLSPCSPGWKIAESETVSLSALAVRSRVFPLLEVEEGGRRRRITVDPPTVPVRRYLEGQGRFRHLQDAEVERIQKAVDERWTELCERFTRPASDSSPEPRTAEPRRVLPPERELLERISRIDPDLSGPECEFVREILSSLWNDPVHAQESEEELIGLAITVTQLSGSF